MHRVDFFAGRGLAARPAPTRCGGERECDVDPVGAGSTREGRTAVQQMHRVDFFAGRARSHRIATAPCASGAGGEPSTREGCTAVRQMHRHSRQSVSVMRLQVPPSTA